MWLKNKNISNNTIDCYMARLNALFKNKHKIDKNYMLLKKAELEEALSPRTVNLLVNAINSYIDFYIEKFEDNSDKCDAAIILMTADDEGKSLSDSDFSKRARQNVIFEAGYFMGAVVSSCVTEL